MTIFSAICSIFIYLEIISKTDLVKFCFSLFISYLVLLRVAAQVIIDPNSPIPLVGASGAIAGVLGGYLILVPNCKSAWYCGFRSCRNDDRATCLYRFRLLVCIASGEWRSILRVRHNMVVESLSSLHIGGFVAGLILTVIFMNIVKQPPQDARNQMLYERANRYRF